MREAATSASAALPDCTLSHAGAALVEAGSSELLCQHPPGARSAALPKKKSGFSERKNTYLNFFPKIRKPKKSKMELLMMKMTNVAL